MGLHKVMTGDVIGVCLTFLVFFELPLSVSEYCLEYFISIFCLSVLHAPFVEKPWSGEIRLE